MKYCNLFLLLFLSCMVCFGQNNKPKEEPYYILTLEIRQSTFTLDIGEHIKNRMNKVTLSIAVDKRFYDKVKVGDEISNTLKKGSLLFNGDFSKLKVTVIGKKKVPRDVRKL